jgi:glycosyltransferase involved in cell wall biosynthesis
MRVALVLPTLVDGDAVGNDVFGMARALRAQGCDVLFFAWTSRVNEPVKGPEDLSRVMTDPNDAIIYHHSIGCEWAVKAIERLPAKFKAVKYHNVTPPEFFKHLNREIAAGCREGIQQVSRIARTSAHIWADSEFNALDIPASVPGRLATELPPFHQADQLLNHDPDYRSVTGLDDWCQTILVVGRLVPNKNIPLAIKTFAEYRARYEPRSRLVIVGDRPVPEHAAEVDQLIAEHGLEGRVFVTGKVSVSQLKALYITADALLVTSLHEGFCVPLIEAMGLRLPVVAVPNAAIPYTGGEAISYASPDEVSLANKLYEVLGQPIVKEMQIHQGWQRYADRFTNAKIEEKFLVLWQELLASA